MSSEREKFYKSKKTEKELLSACKTCGELIAPLAETCPHCGQIVPTKERTTLERGSTIAAAVICLCFCVFCCGTIFYFFL